LLLNRYKNIVSTLSIIICRTFSSHTITKHDKIIGELFCLVHEELSRLPQQQDVDHIIKLINRETPIPCVPYWHFLLENEDLEKPNM
jgi:hypothetical protein